MSSNKNVHSTYVYKGKLNVRAPRNLSNSCDKEGGAPLVPWILKQPTKLKPSSRTVSEWIRHGKPSLCHADSRGEPVLQVPGTLSPE